MEVFLIKQETCLDKQKTLGSITGGDNLFGCVSGRVFDINKEIKHLEILVW